MFRMPQKQKTAPKGGSYSGSYQKDRELTLTCFEATLCLIDHVNAALAAHNTAVAVPVLERAERVLDLHVILLISRRGMRHLVAGTPMAWGGEFMVGDTGIEPVTPSMSTKCSTAELITHEPA